MYLTSYVLAAKEYVVQEPSAQYYPWSHSEMEPRTGVVVWPIFELGRIFCPCWNGLKYVCCLGGIAKHCINIARVQPQSFIVQTVCYCLVLI